MQSSSSSLREQTCRLFPLWAVRVCVRAGTCCIKSFCCSLWGGLSAPRTAPLHTTHQTSCLTSSKSPDGHFYTRTVGWQERKCADVLTSKLLEGMQSLHKLSFCGLLFISIASLKELLLVLHLCFMAVIQIRKEKWRRKKYGSLTYFLSTYDVKLHPSWISM